MNTGITEKLEEKDIDPTQLSLLLILTTILVAAGLNMHFNETEEGNIDFNKTTCELAKMQSNATLYYNDSLKMCIKPGTEEYYNHSVNKSG